MMQALSTTNRGLTVSADQPVRRDEYGYFIVGGKRFPYFQQSLRFEYQSSHSVCIGSVCASTKKISVSKTAVYIGLESSTLSLKNSDGDDEVIFQEGMSSALVPSYTLQPNFTAHMLSIGIPITQAEIVMYHMVHGGVKYGSEASESGHIDNEDYNVNSVFTTIARSHAFISDLSLPKVASEDELRSIAEEEGVRRTQNIEKAYPIFADESCWPIVTDGIGGVSSVSDLILSRVYAASDRNITAQFFGRTVAGFLEHNEFSRDVTIYLGIMMARGSEFPKASSVYTPFLYPTVSVRVNSDPLVFIDAWGSNGVAVDFTFIAEESGAGSDAGGLYDVSANIIAIKDHNPEFLIHEMTHAAANLFFLNRAAPYPRPLQGVIESKAEEYKAAADKVEMLVMGEFGNDYSVRRNFSRDPKAVGEQLEFSADKIKLLYHLIEIDFYPMESRHAELFARLSQLHTSGLPKDLISQYLSPVEEYWRTHFSSEVQALQERYKDFCDQRLSDNIIDAPQDVLTFQHCIGELMPNQAADL